MDQILFSESQRMTGGGIAIAVVTVLLLVSISNYRRMSRLVRGVFFIVAALMICTGILLFTLRLETVYHPRYVAYRFASVYGAAYDTVRLDSVVRVQVLTYAPSDYGGWGAKGDLHTEVYNASGNKGIMFMFKSGHKLLLGTQHVNALRQKLNGYYPIE